MMLLTTSEYAAKCGKSIKHIQKLLADGRLPAIKIGGIWQIDESTPYPTPINKSKPEIPAIADRSKANLSKNIITIYTVVKSITRTAIELGVSHSVVRKTLITAGLYESAKTKRIADLRKNGMHISDIAKKIGVSENAISANVPYTRGTYLKPTKSANAISIKKWREKKRDNN